MEQCSSVTMSGLVLNIVRGSVVIITNSDPLRGLECVCQQFLSPDWFWIIGFIFCKSADGRRPRILHSYHPPLWPAAAPSNIMGKWKMEFSCRNIRHSVIRTFEYPVNMSSAVATSQTFSNIFCEWLFSHWHSFFLLMKLQKPEIFN